MRSFLLMIYDTIHVGTCKFFRDIKSDDHNYYTFVTVKYIRVLYHTEAYIYRSLCTQWRTCTQICLKNSLQVSSSFLKRVNLSRSEVVKCAHCPPPSNDDARPILTRTDRTEHAWPIKYNITYGKYRNIIGIIKCIIYDNNMCYSCNVYPDEEY